MNFVVIIIVMLKIFRVKNFHEFHYPRKIFTDEIFLDYGMYVCMYVCVYVCMCVCM